MDYKIICPGCRTKLSRWRYFSSLSIHYRCRNCGGRFRMTGEGFAITFAVVMFQLLWFALGVLEVIPQIAALDVLVVTCSLSVWLLPLLTPVRAEGPSKTID